MNKIFFQPYKSDERKQRLFLELLLHNELINQKEYEDTIEHLERGERYKLNINNTFRGLNKLINQYQFGEEIKIPPFIEEIEDYGIDYVLCITKHDKEPLVILNGVTPPDDVKRLFVGNRVHTDFNVFVRLS